MFNTKEYDYPLVPEATVIPAGEAARDAYGHRWGSQKLEITLDQLSELEKGRQLAVEVGDGEYVLFCSWKQTDWKKRKRWLIPGKGR